MRRLGLSILVYVAVSGAGGAGAQAPPEHVVFVRSGDLWAAKPDGSGSRRLTQTPAVESAPALSPDGALIAFSGDATGDREIYVMRADGSGVLRLTQNPRRDDIAPAWSPDGRQLAWSSQGDVYAMNADGSAKRPLVATAVEELDPAWSPNGLELVYSAGGDLLVVPAGGGTPRQLTSGPANDRQPDWSTRDEVVFVRDTALLAILGAGGTPRQVTPGTPPDSSPSWAPGGGRIVFARTAPAGSDLYVANADGTSPRRLASGAEPDSGRLVPPKPKPPSRPPTDELLPDLEQRAPRGLRVALERGRFRLGFNSAVDNIGQGPVWIVSTRTSRHEFMRANQYVALRGGRGRSIYPDVGIVRYTRSPPHFHWHYMGFERYELRSARDFRLVVRDRKAGFCLADHYGHAARRVRVVRARFHGNCGQLDLSARRIEQGSSVGYTDRYPAHFHGQNLDVTGVPPGRYWLVHRANPRRDLRELRYENNNAAVLIRLRWPDGRRQAPGVSVLRVCEGSERC